MRTRRQFKRRRSACKNAVSSDAGWRGVCSQNLPAAELPPGLSQPALETLRILFSCLRKPLLQRAAHWSGNHAWTRWFVRGLPTDGIFGRSPHARPLQLRADPSLPASEGRRGKINRARFQSPIGFGPVSSESAIIEVRMRRRYSFTNSGRLRAVPAASTSIMAMKTSREAEGL